MLKRKRFISVLISIAMIISSVLPVFAEEITYESDTEETVLCETCGIENGHAEDCAEIAPDPDEELVPPEDTQEPESCSCPEDGHAADCPEYVCEECGQLCNTEAGHAENCPTLCTCAPVDGVHEQGCALFTEEPEADPVCEGCAEDGGHLDICAQYACPECGAFVNLPEGVHAETCPTLKICSCEPAPGEGEPHAEGCDFYVPFSCDFCAGTETHEDSCITNCTCIAEDGVDKSAEDYVHTAEDCPFAVNAAEADLISAPACDCGSSESNIARHSDSCSRKKVCVEWNYKSAEEIFASWNDFDLALKKDLLELISVYDSYKYEQLMKLMGGDVPEFADCTCGWQDHSVECALFQDLWSYAEEYDIETIAQQWVHLRPEIQIALRRMLRNNDTEKSDALKEALSTTISADNVSVRGVLPEGVTLTVVPKPVTEAPASIDPYVSISGTVHFLLDISPRNADNSKWQPDEGDTVTVTVDISNYGMTEGESYTILHIKDDGTIENLHSYTVENGLLSFEMSSFSYVAGLTVNQASKYKYGDYIYFDLRAGDAVISANSYEGYRYSTDGTSLEKVSATGSTANMKFYVYQSTAGKRETISGDTLTPPQYARVKNGTQDWGAYITNNTDVDGVIAAWNTEAPKFGRSSTDDPNTEAAEDFRVIVNAGANCEVTVDNIWSSYTSGRNAGRTTGGIEVHTNTSTPTVVTLKYKGDNRVGTIFYNSSQNYEGNSLTLAGDADATMTVANLATNEDDNYWCAAIGGNDGGSDAVNNLIISSGILYAGTTVWDDCTAIGGGGNGYADITITGGTTTAVSHSSGSAIGGGIGKTSTGGKADVAITGHNTYVYAYNYSSAWKQSDGTYVIIPSSAIGGGGSSLAKCDPCTVNIGDGATVFAQSVGGTAIGGGSSSTRSGGDSTINITGGAKVTSLSVAGNVQCNRDNNSVSNVIVTLNKNGQVISSTTRNTQTGAITKSSVSGVDISPYPAGNSIGGGMGGKGADTSEEENRGNGGACKLLIEGENTVVITGSIGGGGVRTGNDKGGKIGNAEVKIDSGTLQGQVIMTKRDGYAGTTTCTFTMNGGTVDNYDAEKATNLTIDTTSDKTDEHRIYLTRKVTVNGSEVEKTFTFLKPDGSVAYIENGTATINSGTIKNANAANGGAFYVTGGTLTIQQAEGETAPVLENCTATQNGGAVCVMNGSATISGGTITGTLKDTEGQIVNEADKGGAVYVGGGTFTMENTGTVLSDCNAVTAGGTVCVENGTANIKGGTIKNTTAPDGGAVYVGGAAGSNSKFEMSGGSITGFTAANNGGAVCVMNGTATISSGSITGSTSVDEAKKGGAVYVGGGEFEMSGGSIDTNNASTAGGAVCVENGKATISGGTITNVHAANGGAVYVSGSSSTFNMSNTGSISGFYATENGGAVCVEGGTATISGGSITGSTSVDEAKRGGAVYVGGGSFTMTNSSEQGINTCNATEAGGAVCVDSGTATIEGGTIKNTTAPKGGAVYVGGGEFAMSGSSENGINNCNATTVGGAVCVENGTAIISGGNIHTTTAPYGGAVYVGSTDASHTSSFTMSGGSIISCTATTDGGAVYVGGVGNNNTFTMSGDGKISACSAPNGNGGAVCVMNGTATLGGSCSIEGYVEKDNEEERPDAKNGGAVYVGGGSFVMDSTNSTIRNFYATEKGGAVCVEGGTANLKNGNIYTSKAALGGGVYVSGANSAFVMEGGTVGSCEATENGGGVYVGGGSVNLSLGRIEKCTAVKNGGGAYVLNSDVTFGQSDASKNIYITENKAVNGAGLYIEQTEQKTGGTKHTTTVSNGMISNNIASGNGGGIYHTGLYGECTVSGAGKIIRNEAKNGAGLYVACGSKLTVSGGHITENEATGMPESTVTSAEHDSQNIGVGGGIYVASGGSSATPSTFILDVSNKSAGVYNNKADFAADDVYANQSDTSLSLPADINNMALGENFTANGWYGDYVVKDSNFADGLLYAIAGGQDEIDRYRTIEAVADTTVYKVDITKIEEGKRYVCLTIGKTAINFGTLTITKAGANGTVIPDDQCFVFHVQSDSLINTSLGTVSFDVVVKGAGSVVIDRVPFGTYTITEVEEWSWRFMSDGAKTVTVGKENLQVAGTGPNQSVTFKNQIRTDDKYNGLWLDGNSEPEVNVYGIVDNSGETTVASSVMSFLRQLIPSRKEGNKE